MVVVVIVAVVVAAFVFGVVLHSALRSRRTGETVAEEVRRLGFDVFFGILTSRLGGAIARRLTARRAI